MELYDQIQQARQYVQGRTPLQPKIALVLGSGLGHVASKMQDAVEIPFDDIPNFTVSTVPGHSGKLAVGRLGGVEVMLFCGRTHLYEGYTVDQVTLPVRMAVACGVSVAFLTNAAGAVWPHWKAGDFMLISDHINFQGTNPLLGDEDLRLGQRFLDMTDAYDAELRAVIRSHAASVGASIREGVYCAFTGPSYETKAEVRMARRLGADAVGMSTVQEAIAARQMGARTVGLSVLTNLAAGVSGTPLSHDEVKETANRTQDQFVRLITGALPAIAARI
jgi:purine-nucleoside phosphorylase